MAVWFWHLFLQTYWRGLGVCPSEQMAPQQLALFGADYWLFVTDELRELTFCHVGDVV